MNAAEQPIVNLRTLEDLKKVLLVQRMVSNQAKKELLAVASDAELLQNPENIGKKAADLMAEEKKILTKYANNPTMTEFNILPNLKGGTHFGATFAVAVLVGELILEQVKAMQGKFKPVVHRMFMILLMELDRPKHKYLVEPLEKAMTFNVTKPDGSPVPLEEATAYKKRMVHSLVETFLIVCIEYGLVTTANQGYHITELGRRVLLHLLDAEKFVTLLVEAHHRFQSGPDRQPRKI
jgi:hypothetical protein